jgi:hypothetical protein
MLVGETILRGLLQGLPLDSWQFAVLLRRTYCLMTSVFVLSDGSIFAQAFSGMQKSGSNNTGFGNSRMRALLSRWVGALWCATMGDDCVEQWVEGAQEKYASLGVNLKEYTCDPKGFDFCSAFFFYESKHAVPTGFSKGLYNFLNNDDDGRGPPEVRDCLLQQFELVYRHCEEELEQLPIILSAVDWGQPKDDEWYANA